MTVRCAAETSGDESSSATLLQAVVRGRAARAQAAQLRARAARKRLVAGRRLTALLQPVWRGREVRQRLSVAEPLWLSEAETFLANLRTTQPLPTALAPPAPVTLTATPSPPPSLTPAAARLRLPHALAVRAALRTWRAGSRAHVSATFDRLAPAAPAASVSASALSADADVTDATDEWDEWDLWAVRAPIEAEDWGHAVCISYALFGWDITHEPNWLSPSKAPQWLRDDWRYKREWAPLSTTEFDAAMAATAAVNAAIADAVAADAAAAAADAADVERLLLKLGAADGHPKPGSPPPPPEPPPTSPPAETPPDVPTRCHSSTNPPREFYGTVTPEAKPIPSGNSNRPTSVEQDPSPPRATRRRRPRRRKGLPPRLLTLTSLPRPKTTLVADCMRAKFQLDMEQALAWRRSLDLAALETDAAGLPAVQQLLEGIDAHPEQFHDLLPTVTKFMVEGDLPSDAPTLARLSDTLLQGLFTKSDEQFVDEFVRRCIDLRNEELHETEQLKRAPDSDENDSDPDADMADVDAELYEWASGSKPFPSLMSC